MPAARGARRPGGGPVFALTALPCPGVATWLGCLGLGYILAHRQPLENFQLAGRVKGHDAATVGLLFIGEGEVCVSLDFQCLGLFPRLGDGLIKGLFILEPLGQFIIVTSDDLLSIVSFVQHSLS